MSVDAGVVREPPFREGEPFDGVVAYLREQCDGDVHDKGVVIVTAATDKHAPVHAVKNVVDPGDETYYVLGGEQNQFICLDFKARAVRVTHYSLQSHAGPSYLKSLVVEGSVDGRAWKHIDGRKDDRELKGKWNCATFPASEVSDRFRLVRSRMTGESHDSDHILCCSSSFLGHFSGDSGQATSERRVVTLGPSRLSAREATSQSRAAVPGRSPMSLKHRYHSLRYLGSRALVDRARREFARAQEARQASNRRSTTRACGARRP